MPCTTAEVSANAPPTQLGTKACCWISPEEAGDPRWHLQLCDGGTGKMVPDGGRQQSNDKSGYTTPSILRVKEDADAPSAFR